MLQVNKTFKNWVHVKWKCKQTTVAEGIECNIILVQLDCLTCLNLFSDSFCSLIPLYFNADSYRSVTWFILRN